MVERHKLVRRPFVNISAHYTVRSSDGKVGRSVHEADIAWHAGNWTYNTRSIGIEHEGYVGESGWFTDAMYRARPVNGVLLQEAHHRVQRSAWLP